MIAKRVEVKVKIAKKVIAEVREKVIEIDQTALQNLKVILNHHQITQAVQTETNPERENTKEEKQKNLKKEEDKKKESKAVVEVIVIVLAVVDLHLVLVRHNHRILKCPIKNFKAYINNIWTQ